MLNFCHKSNLFHSAVPTYEDSFTTAFFLTAIKIEKSTTYTGTIAIFNTDIL